MLAEAALENAYLNRLNYTAAWGFEQLFKTAHYSVSAATFVRGGSLGGALEHFPVVGEFVAGYNLWNHC